MRDPRHSSLVTRHGNHTNFLHVVHRTDIALKRHAIYDTSLGSPRGRLIRRACMEDTNLAVEAVEESAVTVESHEVLSAAGEESAGDEESDDEDDEEVETEEGGEGGEAEQDSE